METKVNKAQETRDRQNYEYINSDLRRKLLDFENEYLNATVAFQFKVRNNKIKQLEKLIEGFPTREVSRANKYDTVERYQRGIDIVKRELELDATIILKTIVQAKKSFDEKVDKLAKTLVKEGFGHAHYQVELIKDRGSKLEFIISKSDKTVHARLIWVDGVLVEPHFRFITTTRTK